MKVRVDARLESDRSSAKQLDGCLNAMLEQDTDFQALIDSRCKEVVVQTIKDLYFTANDAYFVIKCEEL